MQEMTRRERIIYEFIVLYRSENRVSPSIREITEGVGLHSIGSVHSYIRRLVEKEWLTPCRGKSRALIPLGKKPA